MQKPDGSGWQTIAHVYPRRSLDRRAIDAEGSATLRLVFLGNHTVRSVDRLIVARTETPQPLALTGAIHSRLGDVTDAVGTSGGTTAKLVSGEDLSLRYGVTSIAAGKVRDLFLEVMGNYTARGGSPTAMRRGEVERGYEVGLQAARPNPTSGNVAIGYTLPAEAKVSLVLYDITGRRIRTLIQGVKVAGAHEALWDGRDDGGQRMRPGVYLYRMETGGWRSQRKLVVYAR